MAKTGKGLTVRGKALRWMTQHRGIFEQPDGSNCDSRLDGIRAAQQRLGAWLVGLAWCGVWCANALLAAGVEGVTYRLASVSLIEDDAKAGHGPFRDWLAPTFSNLRRCLRGDLVVMFGRGVHVEMIRSFKYVRGVGWVIVTDGGNTSYGNTGSQSNGGVSTRRERPLSQAHGMARVDFPGGPARRAAGVVALLGRSLGSQVIGSMFGHGVSREDMCRLMTVAVSSDRALLDVLSKQLAEGKLRGTPAVELLVELRRAGVR